jgi:hypothetical protein
MTFRNSTFVTAMLAAAACTQFAATGCHARDSHRGAGPGAAASSASGQAVPLDRLLPGELSASSALVFGFPIPVGMHVERSFADAAHLVGEVTVNGLVDYVRKHATVKAPELADSVLVFDPVHIPSQGESRQYRFEISSGGRKVRLLVRDVTAPPQQPGLTDEERYRQAGLSPNGVPLNATELR